LKIILIFVVVLVAGGTWLVLQQIGGNLRSTEPYRMALDKIRKHPAVLEALGQPISESWRTAGRADQSEADLRFSIQGPKGSAKVHVQARRTQGQWGLVILDVTPESSQKTLNLAHDEADDAPRYEGPKPVNPAKPADSAPAPDIKIDLPVPPGNQPG
jgi:hypothetical protein